MERTKRICSVEGCGRPHKTKGLCNTHDARRRKHGSPFGGRTPNGLALEWLESQVDLQAANCIEWPFPSMHQGYGIVRFRGRSVAASHAMCVLAHGDPVGDRREAAHDCGNRLCVNPSHLRWATTAENQADKVDHGTTNRAERNPMAKLSYEIAERIRASRGLMTQSQIAAEFGLSAGTISLILNNKRWVRP